MPVLAGRGLRLQTLVFVFSFLPLPQGAFVVRVPSGYFLAPVNVLETFALIMLSLKT